jgi:HEAT repeat protein
MSGSESSSPTALIAQLASANPDERAEAAELLCRAGTEAVAATLPLVEACGDDDSRVREWAVAALEELGSPPAEIIDHLAEIAASPEPLGAYWAATLLGRAGGDAVAAVPALATCVASANDTAVRERAAWALGKIGPAALSAREALQQAAAAGKDSRLARLATEALTAIGS